eukprot:IDg9225t1
MAINRCNETAWHSKNDSVAQIYHEDVYEIVTCSSAEEGEHGFEEFPGKEPREDAPLEVIRLSFQFLKFYEWQQGMVTSYPPHGVLRVHKTV